MMSNPAAWFGVMVAVFIAAAGWLVAYGKFMTRMGALEARVNKDIENLQKNYLEMLSDKDEILDVLNEAKVTMESLKKDIKYTQENVSGLQQGNTRILDHLQKISDEVGKIRTDMAGKANR